jgi:hypothetical protein
MKLIILLNVIVVTFFSGVNFVFSEQKDIYEYNYSDIYQQEMYNKAKKGDDKALRTLITVGSNSADELIPVQLLDLLIQDYHRVIGMINRLDGERKVEKKVAFEILRTGFIDFCNYFSRKKMVEYYKKNRHKHSAENHFHAIFNETTIGFVRASSSLDLINYSPFNIYDGDKTTAWVEGTQGEGINDWIIVYPQSFWPEKNVFNAIRIVNGYAKSLDTFYTNHRVKKLFFEFSDGQSKYVELKDTFEPQVIYFNEGVISYIKMTILEVYKGSKYDDTCISEVEFIHQPQGGGRVNNN